MTWREQGQGHQLSENAQVTTERADRDLNSPKKNLFWWNHQIISLKSSTYDNTRFMIRLVYWVCRLQNDFGKWFWSCKVILEIIQFRHLYLLPVGHNNVAKMSRKVTWDVALASLSGCYGNIKRRYKNDFVTTSHYDVSIWDVETTSFL